MIPPDSLILAIDVGSSSVRAMIFDRHGHELPQVFVQVRYSPQTTPDGGAEIDAAEMARVIFECIDSALTQAGPESARIGAVVMDTLVGNLLGLDEAGQPVTPIYTWADRRGGEFVPALREKLDLAAYIQRCGCRFHTSYWPVRLLWLQGAQPESLGRARWWLSIGDYALYLIFGRRRMSLSVASWSGLLNRHTNDWDAETLTHLPVRREQLSELSNAPLQGLAGAWAERWPALRDALWFPAVGDGVASNLGAGCAEPHQIALSVGTSAALRIILPGRPPTPDGLFAYCVDESRSLVGGPLSNAGNLYAWLLRTLQLPGSAELLAEIERIAPDSHGLTILPFLAGERAPGWNDRAQAVFMGMTYDTDPLEIVRAGLEAVAYRLYQIAGRIRPLQDGAALAADPIVVASGAPALSSPPWMQIIADVLGTPVYASLEAEATIRGAVYLAVGETPPPRLGRIYTPNAAHHAVYKAAIERQAALYARLL